MPTSYINFAAFRPYIEDADFVSLFIDLLGWDNPLNSDLAPLVLDSTTYRPSLIARKMGFFIVGCPVERMPNQTECRQLDRKFQRQLNAYLCIYYDKATRHHLWACPVTQNGKRDIVLVESTKQNNQALFLSAKLSGLYFEANDTPSYLEVCRKVEAIFAINSENVTSSFYKEFRRQHNLFASFVSGLEDNIPTKDNKAKQWYTSVMLNRLMFCYFIQKKGFLNGNLNYLNDKLQEVQLKEGENRFYDFYQSFLKRLFQEGLNTPEKERSDWDGVLFGKIPYLNGGMFAQHELEIKYPDIDIQDAAFQNLFQFFNQWRWNLDTRLSATGKDINPDILGYIFEQYINDRAQMGAYYTKEDITGYIGKNCLIPFLLDKTKEKDPSAFDKIVWPFVQQASLQQLEDGSYRHPFLYPELLTGYTPDWRERLPAYIAKGLDPEAPHLLDRRSCWNEPADDSFALPTELWRETIERLERCDSLLERLKSGSIRSCNDFVTYNLDLCTLARDLIRQTDDHLFVKHFYEALTSVTVLDPTCGSGAFLFAALNILEPLYEECLDRMEDFQAQNKTYFADELASLRQHYGSNRAYFIYKKIILNNLYGVDIMVEATEIAKLRLFLKLVAVVDVDMEKPNLGLDPLPDVDFNIRCGNTLVGYASQETFKADLNEDVFAKKAYEQEVMTLILQIQEVYKAFKVIQFSQDNRHQDFVQVKKQLQNLLQLLNQKLNAKLYLSSTGQAYDPNSAYSCTLYNRWLAQTQPFHWWAEFYDIIQGHGGFDVIIGNPPYVSMSGINYIKSTSQFACSDLYGFVIRRVLNILSPTGYHGFIVMHNLAFSSNFKYVRQILKKRFDSLWFSFYSRIPSGLFEGSARVRNCIYIGANTQAGAFSTRLHRWFSIQRPTLLQSIRYNEVRIIDHIPMLNDSTLQNLFENTTGESILSKNGKATLFVKKTAYNCLSITNQAAPTYNASGATIAPNAVPIHTWDKYQGIVKLLCCGKFFMARWMTYGDDFNFTISNIDDFHFPLASISKEDYERLQLLSDEFDQTIPNTLQFKMNASKNVGSYNIRKLWYITDKSDLILLHYLTDCPNDVFELVERHIASSIISDKKATGTNADSDPDADPDIND